VPPIVEKGSSGMYFFQIKLDLKIKVKFNFNILKLFGIIMEFDDLKNYQVI